MRLVEAVGDFLDRNGLPLSMRLDAVSSPSLVAVMIVTTAKSSCGLTKCLARTINSFKCHHISFIAPALNE